MKIGIDARLLSLPITGIGRYTMEMCRELANLDDEYYLYSPSAPLEKSWHSPDVHLRQANYHNRLARMLWSQTLLPYWAAQDRIDVFWGTTHRLPRFLPDSIARVVTIHDLVWKFAGETMRPLSQWMDRRLMPEALKLADRVVADSATTAAAVETEFPELQGKVRVIHPGVSSFPEPGGLGDLKKFGINNPYFLFVGTLEPRKNLPRLLKAFGDLEKNIRKRFTLVIVGGKGWGCTNIAGEINRLGLTSDVCLTDYVSTEDLSTLYAHAHFLTLPSIYEGFGLPVVEAMSFGIPVLVSNTSSLTEVAGDAGLFVDPLDESSITEGLRTLLTDDILYQNLAGRANSNAARFKWTEAARDISEVFAEALAERRIKS